MRGGAPVVSRTFRSDLGSTLFTAKGGEHGRNFFYSPFRLVVPLGTTRRLASDLLVAEAADGTRDQKLALVLTPSGDYVVKEEEPGDKVVLRMYTPSMTPDRIKPTEISFQAPGCEKVRIEDVADALFWTESAAEESLFPYYVAHRLFTDEEMQKLRKSFRDRRVVAIWHVAPSHPRLQYAKDTFPDSLSVLVADHLPDGEATTSWRGARDFLSTL